MNILPLEIDGTPKFWQTINTAITSSKMGLFSDNGLIYVAMSDKSKMVPFIRKKEELFSATINSYAKKFRVIINGQFYGVSKSGILDALIGNDPVDPKHTTPEGRVINNGKLIGGRDTPLMFHIENNWKGSPAYKFGFGAAPLKSNSAVGGCGPVIINNLPYGEVNKYSKKVAGKIQGEPSAKNKPFLTQRSNSTFSAYLKRPPYTGKTLIAHSSLRNTLLTLVLPHGATGITLPAVRDKLKNAGFNNAVFLDGSDSSLLVVNGNYIASPGPDKNETNVVGIGFEVL